MRKGLKMRRGSGGENGQLASGGASMCRSRMVHGLLWGVFLGVGGEMVSAIGLMTRWNLADGDFSR